MTEYAGPKTGSPMEEGLGGMGEAEGIESVCVCVCLKEKEVRELGVHMCLNFDTSLYLTHL